METIDITNAIAERIVDAAQATASRTLDLEEAFGWTPLLRQTVLDAVALAERAMEWVDYFACERSARALRVEISTLTGTQYGIALTAIAAA